MNDKYFWDNHFKLHYKINGNGLCLVCLHGYMDNLTFFDDFTYQIKSQYKIIAIDLPGHGHSKYLTTETSIDAIAKSIKELLATEKITSAVFIGHSMGGYVALSMAINHPELVHKLILVHSHPYADSETRALSRQREIEYITDGQFEVIKRAALLNRFHATFLIANPLKLGLLEASINAIIPSDALQTLTILSLRKNYSLEILTSHIPTLICLSPTDKHVNIELVKELSAQSKLIDIALFNNSLHMCHWEEPDLFLNTVVHFINKKN